MNKKEQILLKGKNALRKPGGQGIDDLMIHDMMVKGYHTLERINRRGNYHRIIKRDHRNEWIDGRSIEDHLENTSDLIIYTITLGHEVDRIIREISVVDLPYAVILDVLANELLEYELLMKFYQWEGCYGKLTGPFSPGYGDYPLSISEQIIQHLKKVFNMGITVNPYYHLRPQKTITGIAGIKVSTNVENNVKGLETNQSKICQSCEMKIDCSYN